MPARSTDRLAGIKNFDQLLEFLADELDWPIEDMDIEESTFDYDAEDDLGLDPKTAAKIQCIKQLRPLHDGQPFGIFFVEFDRKRLPVVAMRRILGRLVTRKRASANPADRKTWDQHDLIFVSACGEDRDRRIDFAHFAPDAGNGLPTLRVLGWDGDDTDRKLDWVEKRLREKLSWPDGADADEWRLQWRDAFILEHREVVRTAKDLANRLADLAKRIRTRVLASMDVETEKGPLKKLHKAFQDSLIHDLKPAAFADMYAQTIAYGLLSARMSRPGGLVADDAAMMVPNTNPFLRELMEEFLRIGGRQRATAAGPGIDFDELGVNDVVELLRKANMEAVIADFGREKPGEDPVIHFYESFMTVYDKKQKVSRGVFYTPRPVVSFIVRSVDEILRDEFGLPLGLADMTTWAEMVKKHAGLKIPDTVKPEGPFVQILDPATGTGTFLVEVIDLVHKRMIEHWKAAGRSDKQIAAMWNEYVPEHLLPRLYGFELMMAPYAIAHMKIGLKLADTGYRFQSEQRLRVFLTNALEPATDLSEMLEFVAPFLAHEARAANAVKQSVRPTVVVGNPPYSGISSNMGDWIDGLLKGRRTEGGARHSYYECEGQPLREKKLWLQDDYVKFIRLSQLVIERAGVGILGLITNNGYLDNPTFRGMRASLCFTFARSKTVDLHGNSKKRETTPSGEPDGNVFDIEQGVAVGLFVRPLKASPSVRATLSIWGSREDKYSALDSVADVGEVVRPDPPYWFLGSRKIREAADANSWLSIRELFDIASSGVITARDDLVMDFDRQPIIDRMEILRKSSVDDGEIRRRFFGAAAAGKYPPGDSRGWSWRSPSRAHSPRPSSTTSTAMASSTPTISRCS